MKRISCLLGGVLLSVAASAQLTVMPSGKTYIGDLPNDTQDPDGVITLQVFGPGKDNGNKGRIAIGDYGRASSGSCNVMLAEYGDMDSDQLWLHGKNGIYQTFNKGYEADVVSYYDPIKDAANYNFKVSIKTTKNINCKNLTASNKVTCKELLNTSDRRLKSDIQPIGNSTANLMKLTGVSYYLHSKGEEASLRSGSDNKRDMGLIAQDLMKVYPDLVFEDEEGYYAVNYIGLIPVLIESIKEQQTTIEKLNDKIGKLEAKSIGQLSDATEAVLLQNTPNPFNESTSIEYKIPATATSASIIVYNMEGAQLKEYKINSNGAGSIQIKGSEFAAGMYLYALIVGNELIDTKRMILTK